MVSDKSAASQMIQNKNGNFFDRSPNRFQNWIPPGHLFDYVKSHFLYLSNRPFSITRLFNIDGANVVDLGVGFIGVVVVVRDLLVVEGFRGLLLVAAIANPDWVVELFRWQWDGVGRALTADQLATAPAMMLATTEPE